MLLRTRHCRYHSFIELPGADSVAHNTHIHAVSLRGNSVIGVKYF